jgi:hypothetical protein
MARNSVTGVAVNAGSGPGVVWLVFFFFSSASLGR